MKKIILIAIIIAIFVSCENALDDLNSDITDSNKPLPSMFSPPEWIRGSWESLDPLVHTTYNSYNSFREVPIRLVPPVNYIWTFDKGSLSSDMFYYDINDKKLTKNYNYEESDFYKDQEDSSYIGYAPYGNMDVKYEIYRFTVALVSPYRHYNSEEYPQFFMFIFVLIEENKIEWTVEEGKRDDDDYNSFIYRKYGHTYLTKIL